MSDTDLGAPLSDSTEWTLGALRSAARVAASRCRFPANTLEEDPIRLAEAGVGMAIAENPHIHPRDAINAGQDEIFHAAHALRHAHGLHQVERGKIMPRYLMFWLDRPSIPSPDRVEDPLTLDRVLSQLPAQYRQTLIQAAFSDTSEEAAAMAGITRGAWLGLLRRARAEALRLWFDWETPPSLSRLPVKRRYIKPACPKGHPFTDDNLEWYWKSGRRYYLCRTCQNILRDNRRNRTNRKTSDE